MMNKNLVKAIAAVSLAAMMTASLTACGSAGSKAGATTTSASVANPVKEMSEEDMTQETGIDLPAPEGATDVVYSVIDTEDGKIAQMDCNYDGEAICLRACHTDLLSLAETDPNKDPRDFDTNKGDISGLNYTWNQVAEREVQDRAAFGHVSKQGPGYVAWVDVVPGILYNLSMTDHADMDKLIETANAAFVPMQGEC